MSLTSPKLGIKPFCNNYYTSLTTSSVTILFYKKIAQIGTKKPLETRYMDGSLHAGKTGHTKTTQVTPSQHYILLQATR